MVGPLTSETAEADEVSRRPIPPSPSSGLEPVHFQGLDPDLMV